MLCACYCNSNSSLVDVHMKTSFVVACAGTSTVNTRRERMPAVPATGIIILSSAIYRVNAASDRGTCQPASMRHYYASTRASTGSGF